jgi:hypothetical protein
MAKRKKTTKDYIVFNSEKVEGGESGVGSPSPTARKLKVLNSKTTRKIRIFSFKRIEKGKTWGGSRLPTTRKLKT